MKLSIITVAYNSAATIAQTLRSVAMQTHRDIEHIVVDGASTDETLALVQAHVHAHAGRAVTVLSEPDAGIYDAMNKGLRLATGEFVGFLNADDLFADEHCAAAIVEAARDPAVDAVMGDLLYVDKHRPERAIRYWRCGAFSASKLRFGWMPPHPTLYVRRARVGELGMFRTDFRIAADYEFMLRYLGRDGARVAYVPKVLVHMRTGGASNRSLPALLNKSREDLRALRMNRVGGVLTLVAKNLRKIPQFFLRPRPRTD